jgi:hypothetical protein
MRAMELTMAPKPTGLTDILLLCHADNDSKCLIPLGPFFPSWRLPIVYDMLEMLVAYAPQRSSKRGIYSARDGK